MVRCGKERKPVLSLWRKLLGFYCMFPSDSQILQKLAFLVVCHGVAAGQIPSRYFLIQSPVPWVKAREFCQSHYVDLAVLATEEEYLTLLNAIPAIKVSFWLGLQRQSVIGGWKWVSGEELDYKNRWYRINNQGLCVSLEAMLKTEEKLLARYCDEPHMIVCQGPVSPRSVAVASVGSSDLSISWNVSAFMQMTTHSYNVTVCHSVCETYFYPYTGSSFMSVYISSLAPSKEYFIQISAFVVRPGIVTGGQVVLQDNPATLQVKTMDPEPQHILFIFLKLLTLMFLAPPLWILYCILKKELFTVASQDQSSEEPSAQDTVIDLLPEKQQWI